MNDEIQNIKTAIQNVKEYDNTFANSVLQIEKVFIEMNIPYRKYETSKGIELKNDKMKCLIQDLVKKVSKVNTYEKVIKEKENLNNIKYHIENDTPTGQKIKSSFTKDGMSIVGIEVIGGRGKHHDLVLKLKTSEGDVVEETCELKYSQKKTKINTSKPPWISGVQFSNGSGKLYIVGMEYVKAFYNVLPELKDHYNIEEPIPSFEDYYNDVMLQGKPKTPFVCKIRDCGYKSTFLSDFRKNFNKTFKLDEKYYPQLIEEVSLKVKESFNEKDNWLQIHGSLDHPDNFNIHWTGKIMYSKIVKMECIPSKENCHFIYNFICEDNTIITGIFRWGYGQCISNLRMDLK